MPRTPGQPPFRISIPAGGADKTSFRNPFIPYLWSSFVIHLSGPMPAARTALESGPVGPRSREGNRSLPLATPQRRLRDSRRRGPFRPIRNSPGTLQVSDTPRTKF